MKNAMEYTKIEKEDIPFLHFPKDDVLFSQEDRKTRDNQLSKAITLGNIEHFKVTINFQDVEGAKSVTTTIWGITDDGIILKKGVVIPKKRIHQISFI